jgi:hypothetical protein
LLEPVSLTTLTIYLPISGPITLFPQVTRCLNGTLPDLGYAYDPLDYTLSTLWLKDGGKITVLPGTAIDFRFDWYVGFLLDQGTAFISQGTPNKPITYAPVSLVQEGPFVRQSSFPGLMLPSQLGAVSPLLERDGGH